MNQGDHLERYAQPRGVHENEDFLNNIDLDKILNVLRKSIPWLIIIFSITCSAAYLYVRYTKPVFESESVIKLDLQSEASIIGISNPLENSSISGLSGEIELLKSDLFFDRVIKAINYDISYHYYGKILVEERYKNSPFAVSFKVKNNSFYDKAIDLEIIDEGEFRLEYAYGSELYNQTHQFGEEIRNEHFNFLVEKTPSFSESNGVGNYYFTINSDRALINYFQRNIKVEPLNFNAKTIRISLKDHNKFKARDFVTAIDTLYLAYTKEAKNKAIEQKISFLNGQLELTNLKLEEYETYFEDFTIRNRTTSLENDLGEAIAMLEELDTQYVTLKTELTNIDLIIAQIESDQPMIISPMIVSSLPPVMGNTLAEYNRLKSERELKLASYNENTFVIQRLDQQLQTVEADVKKLFAQYQNTLQSQVKSIDSRRKALENSFVQLPSMGTEFRKNRRFYNLHDETYLQLVKSKSELEIARAGTVTNFVILSPASSPGVPVEPQKWLIYGIGLVAGLVLSVVFILIRYLLHNRINSVRELERATTTPILGSIPYFNINGSAAKLVIDKNARSGLSEALRAVRTNMEFLNPDQSKRIISITSTISGEGKTFISVNLGAILALSNKKVVVVDLDMRKPKVHLAFGDDKGNGGVSTLLIGKEELNNCLHTTKIKNLHYLTAGPTPPNPSELMLGKSFDDLLSQLRKKFDVVLLDTPPVGLVTDGILAMQRADLAIYVFRADYSKKSFVTSLNNLVKTDQFKNLSVIVNSIKHARGYGYGNGYGYGYGNGYYDEEGGSKNGSIFRIPKLWKKNGGVELPAKS